MAHLVESGHNRLCIYIGVENATSELSLTVQNAKLNLLKNYHLTRVSCKDVVSHWSIGLKRLNQNDYLL